ncbi:MAG: response regulator, partial [Desulfomonilaceae bacterium]
RLILELQHALAQVKKLSGFIPICASCKKIRDDKGYWRQVEEYIRDHSEALFSHSICPDCMKKLYPEIANDVLSKLEK